jgi:hypothetical protein
VFVRACDLALSETNKLERLLTASVDGHTQGAYGFFYHLTADDLGVTGICGWFVRIVALKTEEGQGSADVTAHCH